MVALMTVSYVGGRMYRSLPPLVEVGVQGAGVDGLLDPLGQFVALPVQACDVFRAEVVSGSARVLLHGGCVLVRLAFDFAHGLLVVFLEAGVHGTFGLADVGSVARVGVASGARDVVDQG